jgi:hypothetical protein
LRIRFDVIDKKFEKSRLRVAIDTPPIGLTAEDCREVIKVIIEAKKELEKKIGHAMIRISLDDFATSVFWNTVFHRAIVFDVEHPTLGGRKWCVADLCWHPEMAAKMQFLNLGLVYDALGNRLVLIWPEAFKGILQDFDKFSLWSNILKGEKARFGGEVPLSWWKTCANMHSFVIPKWQVSPDFLKEVLWHRPGLTLDDITVFNLVGLEFPRILTASEGSFINEFDQANIKEMCLAKKAKFVRFYSEDRRDFKNVADLFKRKKNPADTARKERTEQWMAKRKEKRRHWRLAGRCLQKLGMLVTPIDANKIGRYKTYIKAEEADLLFEAAASNIKNGMRPRSITRFMLAISDLKEHLDDPLVPSSFKRWLELEELVKSKNSSS